jgi:hypothetical protein
MSPLTSLPSVASLLSEGSSGTARRPTARPTSVPAVPAVPAASPAPDVFSPASNAASNRSACAPSASETVSGNTKAHGTAKENAKASDVSALYSARLYSARTSFDVATGEWALIIERHPPEVGVTIAEQKGFLSRYSAIVNSPTNLRNALSMRI